MAVSLLREQIKSAHEFLEGTLADVSSEDAHWKPGGLVNPIGAQYAHSVSTEDAMVNAGIKNGTPLFAGEYAGKSGFGTPPPAPEVDAGGLADWREWAQSLQVDMDALRRYAQAVYAATDNYLGTLSDDDLSRKIPSAFGEMPLGTFLSVGVLANYCMHCGEISALKGLRGRRGYPF